MRLVYGSCHIMHVSQNHVTSSCTSTSLPHVVAHATNPNDIMHASCEHAMHWQVGQSLGTCDVPTKSTSLA